MDSQRKQMEEFEKQMKELGIQSIPHPSGNIQVAIPDILKGSKAGNSHCISNLAPAYQQDPKLRMEILQILISQLDSDILPDDSSSTENVDYSAKLSSLNAIVEIVTLNRGDISAMRKITNAWPAIFKWCRYLFERNIRTRGADPEHRKRTLNSVPMTIHAIGVLPGMLQKVLNTAGTLELATELWILGDGWGGPDITTEGHSLLGNLLRDWNSVREDDLDKIMKVTKGRPNVIARLAITRLKSAINSADLAQERVKSCLKMICTLASLPSHNIQFAFLDAGIVPICTKIGLKAIRAYTSRGTSTLVGIASTAIQCLDNCLEATDGFTWVCQSVEAGLMPFIIACGLFFQTFNQPVRNILLNILDDVIPRYLAYRSVVEATYKSIQGLNADPIKSTPLEDAWNRTQLLCTGRWLLAQSNKVHEDPGWCAQCLKKDQKKKKFKRCTGCHIATYCSTECQTIAWRNGHSEACKEAQQGRLADRKQPLLKPDRSFFGHLAEMDAWTSRHKLHQMAKRKYPNVPLLDLMIYIDYTMVPRRIFVLSLRDYRRLTRTGGTMGGQFENDDKVIEDIRRGRHTFIEYRISEGRAIMFNRAAEMIWWRGDWLEKDPSEEQPDPDSLVLIAKLLNADQRESHSDLEVTRPMIR
ncbi:hypothetical protein M422DRAFT_226924 [Sphaerobolus stellatus SS14]|uniref:Unplaced genomic scaffold SPHSTscaffold_35, whole genome shotgun sequence n=1 Tax=Sphaerobolus stellatus (strain SS14) TaxID=990650 RepID=A0A0C9VFV7_SPHS4|nr:hypothetical protein M422DRAFT_226924 [Sphaerobolus stellatus SS14]